MFVYVFIYLLQNANLLPTTFIRVQLTKRNRCGMNVDCRPTLFQGENSFQSEVLPSCGTLCTLQLNSVRKGCCMKCVARCNTRLTPSPWQEHTRLQYFAICWARTQVPVILTITVHYAYSDKYGPLSPWLVCWIRTWAKSNDCLDVQKSFFSGHVNRLRLWKDCDLWLYFQFFSPLFRSLHEIIRCWNWQRSALYK